MNAAKPDWAGGPRAAGSPREDELLNAFLKRMTQPVGEEEKDRVTEMLRYEVRLWGQGYEHVAGVDEAGRGPLAGPIVAAAVILGSPIPGLDDSKRLSAVRRQVLCTQILDGAHLTGVAVIPAAEIDAHGIQQANFKAMVHAVAALGRAPEFVLVDGFSLQGLPQPTMKLIKGDRESLSIAAASILAKVTRDALLIEVDKKYPDYGFARHKGYGTREHMKALERHGPCPEHRKSFAPLAIAREEPFLL